MTEQASISMIFGVRGTGKTTKVRELTNRTARVLFYDTLGRDYSEGVVCESLDELKAFWRRVYRQNFRIVYRPVNPEADFDTVCRMVFAAGKMTFVVEEVDTYIDGQGRASDEFRQLIQRGRHADVDMICVTQTPKGFGRLLTSQTETFYLFATREPDHLDYFRKRFGRRLADELGRLPKFRCIERNAFDLLEEPADDETGDVEPVQGRGHENDETDPC